MPKLPSTFQQNPQGMIVHTNWDTWQQQLFTATGEKSRYWSADAPDRTYNHPKIRIHSQCVLCRHTQWFSQKYLPATLQCDWRESYYKIHRPERRTCFKCSGFTIGLRKRPVNHTLSARAKRVHVQEHQVNSAWLPDQNISRNIPTFQ